MLRRYSKDNTLYYCTRVKWGKMGHFFDYFLISLNFLLMKNFMIDDGQCVFSLLPQKRKLLPRNERGGPPTPFQKRLGDPFYPI